MLPESFDRLPGDADVWIYAAASPLDADAELGLEQALDELISAWSSHGRRVLGARAVLDRRIVIVSAFVPDGTISGCGIDKSLHVLDSVAAEHGFKWADGLSVVYRRRDGSLDSCSRPAFRDLTVSRSVDASTSVVDLSLRRLGELRSNGLERPAGESWHARVFDLAPARNTSTAGASQSP